jgi:hypothetical protein
VHCAADGADPNRETTGADQVALKEMSLASCYAHNPKTELSSPLARFKSSAPTKAEALTLTATPGSGAFEQPVLVKLEASEPDAFIVYTVNGGTPTSGSPLYSEPIFIPGPATVTAMAIAPDGRVTAPLALKLDVSLELINADHTLEREFDPAVPAKYDGRRPMGR